MDYTSSDGSSVHSSTGNRMHKQNQPIPTEVSDVDMNSIIWELVQILKDRGIPRSAFNANIPATYSQLSAALRLNSLSAVAGGSANVITASFIPPVTALSDKMLFAIRATGANTLTAPTFTPGSGIAGKIIVKGSNAALAAGDIPGAAAWAILQYDAVLDRFVLINPASGIYARNVQHFTANGTFTVPAGITKLVVSLVGGGGGGAGAISGAPYTPGGGGGGGVAYMVPLSVTPGQSIAVTIGAGGAGGLGSVNGGTYSTSNGGSGGGSGFGSLITVAGGGGGSCQASFARGGLPGSAALSSCGASGTSPISESAGAGGGGMFAAPAFSGHSSLAGNLYGGGGAGGRSGLSYWANGGNGASGFCLVEF